MADSNDISEQDKALFRRTVGNVAPVRHDQAVYNQGATQQQWMQRRGRLHGRISVNSLAATRNPEPDPGLEVGDELYFKRPGVQQKVMRKLKRGQFRTEATADLHGKTVSQARHLLMKFLQNCHQRNNRCVLIIHGKGHGSANRKPVIKNRIDGWLRESGNVLAFCSARPEDGGTGAVYALLKTSVPIQGKNS